MSERLMKFLITRGDKSLIRWLTPEEAEQVAAQCRHPTRAFDSIVPMSADPLILEDE